MTVHGANMSVGPSTSPHEGGTVHGPYMAMGLFTKVYMTVGLLAMRPTIKERGSVGHTWRRGQHEHGIVHGVTRGLNLHEGELFVMTYMRVGPSTS